MGFETGTKVAAYMKLFSFSLIGEAKAWIVTPNPKLN